MIVRFDRARDALFAANARAKALVMLMRLAERATAPFGHIGISRLHGAIGRLFPGDSITEIGLRSGGTFSYPSGDYYWNRLLSKNWDYEEDIQAILLALKDQRYTFLDVGANFGFFSCLAASPAFGSQKIVTVEPLRFAFSFLERNLSAYKGQCENFRLAIDEVSGTTVALHGARHAGMSLSEKWYGANASVSDEVLTTTIDDLMQAARMDQYSQPVLIKLEVEGIEMRALRGARKTIEGDVAFIVEEIDATGVSECARHLHKDLGFTMFYARDEAFVELKDLESFEMYRRTQQGLQPRGTSLLAFKLPVWRQRFKTLINQD